MLHGFGGHTTERDGPNASKRVPADGALEHMGVEQCIRQPGQHTRRYAYRQAAN